MKELLTFIAQSLVEHPDKVEVTEREEFGEIIFEVRVADGDMGRIIGGGGRIAKEIRALMRSVARRQEKRIMVNILDPLPE